MFKRAFIIRYALLIFPLWGLGGFFGGFAFSQIPRGYYDHIDGKTDRNIKTSLSFILKDHTVLKYNSLWYYFRTTDVKPGGAVWDMYSNTVRYYNPPTGSTASVSGMDREHSLPKSWWGVSSVVDQYDAYTDLNHLFPGDATANQRKSNFMLGEVAAPTFDNGVSKVGLNAYSFSGSPRQTAFEPGDEYKGDFARIYFYMITCYEDYAQQWRTEALYMFNQELYPVLQPWAKDMLLKWHRNDPVSEKEVKRNEAVFLAQQNRNPFIDIPNLVEYIWGDSVGYTYNLPEKYKAREAIIMTPPNLSDLYFGEIQPGEKSTNTIVVKGQHLSGNVTVMLFGDGPGNEYFSVSSTAIPSGEVNSEHGYELTLTYAPRSYGTHTKSFVILGGGYQGSSVVYLNGVCSNESSIVPVDTEFLYLYAQNREIFFRSHAPADKIFIYDILGNPVYTDICTGVWQSYLCPAPGVYVVKIMQQQPPNPQRGNVGRVVVVR